jgi:TetR/AcrR family acrAB operon transcriptional repressor
MAASARPARQENGRRDLMDIAIDCFARFGYQATSVDRIAKAAGVTKGALYYHFKDKEDLLFEAVRTRVSQFERRVAGDLGPIQDAPTALHALARVCLDHATKSNHRRFIVTLMVEALDTNARLSQQFREMMTRFRAFLRGIIETGQRQGAFRSDVSPAAAAAIYAGAVMGAEIQYYQEPKAVDLEHTLDTFVEQFLMWLRAPVSHAARGSE